MSYRPNVSRFQTPRPKLQNVRGINVPESLIKVGKFHEALQYTPNRNDIIVSSYPNYGTTWLQYIIWEIVNSGKDPPNMYDMTYRHFPYVELTGTSVIDDDSISPNLLQVHLPYSYLRYRSDALYIYVARNPKDCLVAYYHFHKELPEWFGFENGSFDDFFNCFISGDVAYGDYFSHVSSFYEQKNKTNVLFLTYEEMKIDHPGIIYDIAKFLGEEYYLEVKYDEDIFEKIRENTSFENMKDMQLMAAIDDGIRDGEDLNIWEKMDAVRRGEIGDWRSYLSDEQNRVIEDQIEAKLGGTYLAHLWSET